MSPDDQAIHDEGSVEVRNFVLWSASLLELETLLRGVHRFKLVFMEYDISEVQVQVQVMARLHVMGLPPGQRVEMAPEWEELHPLARALEALPSGGVVHLMGLGDWLRGGERGQRFGMLNMAREWLGNSCSHSPLLVWVKSGDLNDFPRLAPDFWAWRSAVFSFLPVRIPVHVGPMLGSIIIDDPSRDVTKRKLRIAEITRYLQNHPELNPASVHLVLEKGGLLMELGELDSAGQAVLVAERYFKSIDDPLGQGVAKCLLAAILDQRQEFDQALHILQHEVAPVFERFGEVELIEEIRAAVKHREAIQSSRSESESA
ncbi:MAG: hypothetical protein G8237_11725 [Magnetococcales bacterium]|nr:hypothetical protein [Magnetococcales bacterium]